MLSRQAVLYSSSRPVRRGRITECGLVRFYAKLTTGSTMSHRPQGLLLIFIIIVINSTTTAVKLKYNIVAIFCRDETPERSDREIDGLN